MESRLFHRIGMRLIVTYNRKKPDCNRSCYYIGAENTTKEKTGELETGESDRFMRRSTFISQKITRAGGTGK